MATRATTKTAPSTSTEVATVTERVKELVSTRDNLTLNELVAAATTDLERARKAELAEKVDHLPTPKGTLSLSPDQLAVVDAVVQAAANAPAVPDKPVELSTEQRQEHVSFWLACSRLKSLIESRLEIERAVILNDHTIRGEREGDVTDVTPRDKNGWAVLPGEITVDGEDEKCSLEKKTGQAVFTAEDLLAMVEDGELTREDYLAATEPVRVLKQSGFFRLMRKNPSLGTSVARRSKVSKPSISLNRRAK